MSVAPDLSPQQNAVRELRARYERGDLSYEEFRAAFDRILATDDAAGCQAIIAALPVAPRTILDALDQPRAPHVTRSAVPRSKWFVMLLGELRRDRRPWKLGETTNGLGFIGEMNLDLSLAALPQTGVLRVFMGIGEVEIIVPSHLNVMVQACTLLGESRAFGESAEGIFAYSHDETFGAPEAPRLTIQIVNVIGSVTIRQHESVALTSPNA
jgi:hypothetical protein